MSSRWPDGWPGGWPGRWPANLGATTTLAVGSAANGLLAYAFFVLATRGLGAAGAAPVSVLWTWWSLTAAGLTFPLQHWVARSAAARGDEGAARRAMPRVLTTVVAVSVLAAGLAWFAREALFGRGDAWFPVLVAGVALGSALTGIARGVLSARGRLHALATVLALENGTRCAAAGVLVATGAESAVGLGLCLVGGSLAVLGWPAALHLRPSALDAPVGGSDEPALRFLGAASGGQLLAQAVLTGGPVLLALSGGTAAQVTALFAALALFRAPYTLALGLVSPVTGTLTRMSVDGGHDALRRVLALTVAVTLLAAALAAAVGALVGPDLLRLVFGDDVLLSAALSALVGVGSTFAVGSLLLGILALARGRSGSPATSWAGAVLAAAAALAVFAVLLPGEPLVWTCWAFVLAETTAFGSLVVADLRAHARLAG